MVLQSVRNPCTTTGKTSIIITILSWAALQWVSANGITCCDKPDVQLTAACANGIAQLRWQTSERATYGFAIIYGCNTNLICDHTDDQKVFNRSTLRYSETNVGISGMFAYNLTMSDFDNDTCWFWIKRNDEWHNNEIGCSPVYTCNEDTCHDETSIDALPSINQALFNLGPPMITLNCTTDYVTGRRSINATWRLQSFLPSDIQVGSQFNAIPDCGISITCQNGYRESNSTCTKAAKQYGWRFSNIPLIELSCNVTISYDYSEDFLPIHYSGSANCSFPSITGVRLTAIGSQNVGDKLSLRCNVNITEGIASNITLYIQWKINNTVVKNYSLHSMTSVTEFLNLTLLQISDNNTIYQCLAMINTQQNHNISTDFDEFRLIINVPENGLQPMECSVPIESGVSEDANIIWITGDGSVVKTVQNVPGDERGNTTIYRHTLWRKINDKTTYKCRLTLSSNPLLSQLEPIDIELSSVNVIALNYQNISVGEPLHLHCSINITHLNSSVDFIWRANDVELNRTTVNRPSNTSDIVSDLFDLYDIKSLKQEDNNTEYNCRVVINGSPLLTEFGIFNLILPPPYIELSSVNVIALNYQNISVGEPLHLHCSINITHLNSSVDFIWRANDVELNRTTVNRPSNTSDIVSDLFDLYDIKSLKQEDNNTEYNCRVVINGSPLLTEFGIFNLILPPPSSTPSISVTASSSQITSSVSLGTGSINSTTMTTTTEGSSLAFIIAPSLTALLALLILTFIVSILWKRRKSAASKVIYHTTVPPLSDTDYYLAISREQMSTCETVSDRTSWIDPDSYSIISGEMLNYIMYAHKTNPEVLNNLPLNLQSRATSQGTLSLRRSRLSLNHFSESNMMKYIKENDNSMSSTKYVDYHTAKQLSDAGGDVNDASSQNLVSEIVEVQSTPEHSRVFSYEIQQRMPN